MAKKAALKPKPKEVPECETCDDTGYVCTNCDEADGACSCEEGPELDRCPDC